MTEPTTDLAVREDTFGERVAALIPHGESVEASVVGLHFTAELSFPEWQDVGVVLGVYYRWARWALGDWINWGVSIFGDDAYAATEATALDRYDVAHRVTGLSPGTLYNYASICERIAVKRRRPDLDFTVHEPVARLEPDEQVEWLQRAAEEGWTREQLRDAIKESKGEAVKADGPITFPEISVEERIEEAARLVFHQSQRTEDGGAIVPAAPWAQLAAALGEGE